MDYQTPQNQLVPPLEPPIVNQVAAQPLAQPLTPPLAPITQMNPVKRPLFITISAWLTIIFTILSSLYDGSMVMFWSGPNLWFIFSMLIGIGLYIIPSVGLLKMQRWGVYLYSVLAIKTLIAQVAGMTTSIQLYTRADSEIRNIVLLQNVPSIILILIIIFIAIYLWRIPKENFNSLAGSNAKLFTTLLIVIYSAFSAYTVYTNVNYSKNLITEQNQYDQERSKFVDSKFNASTGIYNFEEIRANIKIPDGFKLDTFSNKRNLYYLGFGYPNGAGDIFIKDNTELWLIATESFAGDYNYNMLDANSAATIKDLLVLVSLDLWKDMNIKNDTTEVLEKFNLTQRELDYVRNNYEDARVFGLADMPSNDTVEDLEKYNLTQKELDDARNNYEDTRVLGLAAVVSKDKNNYFYTLSFNLGPNQYIFVINNTDKKPVSADQLKMLDTMVKTLSTKNPTSP